MIESYAFGRMTIDGVQHQRDLKIVGGRVAAGWWRKEGHRVDVDDVRDILEARPEVLVVGTGAHGLMRVTGGLREALAEQGIELVAEPSDRAAETFNRLLGQGRRAAAAFHLTC